jgi:carboxylesterase type B
VNVWTQPQTGELNKAVMVFIYGGSFTTGASSIPAYNGQYIANEEDMVVVTFKYVTFNTTLLSTNRNGSYRENIFGFPGAGPNVGLLDQRLAIEWVRDNIEGFGGDPARITLVSSS